MCKFERMMRHSREKGFTLLELVVVLVVIALAIAISYPSLSRGTSALHLRSVGRDVLNSLRYARERAITEQTVMRVTVNKGERKITLTDDYGEGSRTFVLPDDVRIQSMVLAGQEVREGPLVVRFLPNGSATEAEILLQSVTGGALRIVADSITGGARVVVEQRGGR